MERAGAQALQSLQVLRGAVPFVLSQAIAGELAIQFNHEVVSGDLGDYRRRSYRNTYTIAVDHTFLWNADARQAHIINKKVIRAC